MRQIVKQEYADAHDNMKSIEAINAIIILVLGVLVILAVLGLFMGVWSPAKSGTSLQAVTTVTCLKINPTLCNNGKYDIKQARIPVNDFDANKNGIINDFHWYEGRLITTYCVDDNLETLCGFWYGCKINPCPPDATLDTFDPTDPTKFNINTEELAQEWYNCCVKRVCGCE
jgi:hypothetical protein